MLVNSKQESGALDQSAQPAARVWFGVKHPDAFESTGLAIDTPRRDQSNPVRAGRLREGTVTLASRVGECGIVFRRGDPRNAERSRQSKKLESHVSPP